MSLSAVMAEDRRGVVLKLLAEDSAYRLNEDTLKTALRHVGHSVTSDVMQQTLIWLEQHQLVRIERLPGDGRELWLAELTRSGLDIARGATHVGITRPGPR